MTTRLVGTRQARRLGLTTLLRNDATSQDLSVRGVHANKAATSRSVVIVHPSHVVLAVVLLRESRGQGRIGSHTGRTLCGGKTRRCRLGRFRTC